MRIAPLFLSAVLLATAAAAPAAKRADPEAQLAKALEGRVPGKPVTCIRQIDIRSSRIFSRTAILYEMRNGRYYVNRPKGGAAFLDPNDILVTDTHSQDLCNVDIVRLLDQGTRFPSGSLGLDLFVPYDQPGKAAR